MHYKAIVQFLKTFITVLHKNYFSKTSKLYTVLKSYKKLKIKSFKF